MKILIKNGTLISMSSNRPKIEENVDVLIENNKIIAISKNIDIDENMKVIDATNKIIMPGLINTHSHVAMSIFRETVDGLDLQTWLTKKIWPLEDKLTESDIYYASYLSFIEMIKSGTTAINDMYFMTDSIIKAALDSGVRLETTRTLIGMGNDSDALKKIDELEYLINSNHHENITFNIGIHGLYTTDKSYIEKCLELQEKTNLKIHLHFCENEQEKKDIQRIHQKEPLQILEEKFKNKKMILAHCVQLSDDEIKRLAKLNVSISHCPVSNLKLACGIANITKMQELGINISLGTDGQGSGCNLDMFETMKFTALLQKGKFKDATLMHAYDILKMATINGAIALGLENKIGSIETNKLADIILIDTCDIKMNPTNDLISQIVYNAKANNVSTTIVNGKILMENKKLTNDMEREIIEKCNIIIKRISQAK